MASSLADIRVLRYVLGQLNAERRAERPGAMKLRNAFTLYQDRGGDFRKRLLLEVMSRRNKARVLVTGQIGVGKSSELWDFRQERSRKEDAGFPIFCDLENQEHPERCTATGVFLTIFRDCWSTSLQFPPRFNAGRVSLEQIREEVLTQMIDWRKGVYNADRSEVIFSFGGMDYPVTLTDRSRALAIILGKAAQHEAVSQPGERFGLIPDTLIILLNKLLKWFAYNDQGRATLLIIDHVDKIRDPLAAEDVLVKSQPQWKRLEASVIMTAPYEHTLGELRQSVSSYWDRTLMIYPMPIPEPDVGPIPEIYRKIARGAGLEQLIQEDALRALARYSGGILRTFVQALIMACKEAHLLGHAQIDPGDARSVVLELERDYLDYGTKSLELLDQIESFQTGLGEAATLLRTPIGVLVTEPRSHEQELRVHPLAWSALERYRLKKAKAKV